MTPVTPASPPKRKKNPTTWPRAGRVAEQLIREIRSGKYLPGEVLPSTRQFAAGTVPGYAPMAIYTVTGVFALVKQSGLVTVPRGQRMRVLPFAQWPPGCYDPQILVRHPQPEGYDGSP